LQHHKWPWKLDGTLEEQGKDGCRYRLRSLIREEKKNNCGVASSDQNYVHNRVHEHSSAGSKVVKTRKHTDMSLPYAYLLL
jgi:hypothetical protein